MVYNKEHITKMKKISLVIGIIILFYSFGYSANIVSNNDNIENYILIGTGKTQGKTQIGTWKDIDTIPELKGKQGIQGERGDKGKGLKNSQEIQAEVILLDTKKTTTSIYYINDFNNQNNTIGLKITIKLGKSYELRKIEELEKKLKKLIEVLK